MRNYRVPHREEEFKLSLINNSPVDDFVGDESPQLETDSPKKNRSNLDQAIPPKPIVGFGNYDGDQSLFEG
jgi:hypothetical protein